MENDINLKIHVHNFFWQDHFVYYQTSSVDKTISLKQVPGFSRRNTHSVGWWQQKLCHWHGFILLISSNWLSILTMNKSNYVCRLEASEEVLSTSLAAGTPHQKLMWTRTCSLKTFCEEIDSFCRKSAHTHHKIFVANCDFSVLQKLGSIEHSLEGHSRHRPQSYPYPYPIPSSKQALDRSK